MKLTEELSLQHCVLVDTKFKPKRRAATPRRRRSKKSPIDKASRSSVQLQAPLTVSIATFLGVESLLYVNGAPADGYKSINLDIDKIVTVRVRVNEKDPDVALEIQADALERFVAKWAKGSGPVLKFWVVATGYVSMIADFIAVIEDHEFTLVCSPVQGQLFDKAPSQPAKNATPGIYAV